MPTATTHPPRQRIAVVCGLALAAITWFAAIVQAASDAAPSNILILQSYHHGMLWADAVQSGLDAGLAGRRPRPRVFLEYLDTKRFPGPARLASLGHALASKYAGMHFDLAVTVDDNALALLTAHRGRISGRAPVVFCGVNHYDPAVFGAYANMTGVVEAWDAEATLSLMLALHPDARRVVIVNDHTTTGKANRRRLEELLPAFTDRVAVAWLSAMSYPELAEALGALQPSDVVLLMSYNQDRTGATKGYRDVARMVCGAATRPVYAVWAFYLGHGIVGGKLTYGADQGAEAARLALRILDGASPQDIPVVTQSPTVWGFDDRLLQRFHIPRDRVPEGARIINRPDEVWHRYWPWLIGALVVFALQGVIIFFLVWTNQHRKEAQEALKAAQAQVTGSRRRLAQIIDHLPDPTFVIDIKGTVVAWNRAVARLSGVPAEDIVGKGDFAYAEPFYGDRRPVMIDLVGKWDDAVAASYRDVRKVGDVLVSETRDPHPRLHGRHFRNVAGPIYDDSGEMVGAIEIIHEITERRKMESEIREREALLRLYAENTPAAVAMCDLEMTYIAVSRRWITDYRLSDEGLIGKCHYDVFETIPEKWREEHRRCFAGEVIENEEEPFQRKDGSVDWVRRSVHPWRDREGEIGGLIMFTEVVTARKRDEHARRESEDRLRTIGDNLPGGMIYQMRVTADGRYGLTYVSDGVRQLYGYRPDEVIEDAGLIYRRIVEEDRARMRAAETAAVAGRSTFDMTVRVRLDDGGIRWHRMVSRPREAENGDLYFDGIDMDISALKKAEEESRKRQSFLESVLYHAPDAIIILSPDHRVLEWNPGAAAMFGYSPEEAWGRELDTLVATGGEAAKEAAGKTRNVLSGNRVESFETVRYRKDGRPIHVIAAGSPILDGGRLTGVVAVYTDISRLKEVEAQLKQNERTLKGILDAAPIGIGLVSNDREIQWVNSMVCRMTGYTEAELVGQNARFLYVSDAEYERVDSIKQPGAQAEGKDSTESRWRRKDGSVFDTHLRSAAIDPGGPRHDWIFSALDITDRKRAEADLKRLRNYLSNIIDSMPSVLVGVDAKGRVTQWNRLAESETGIRAEDATGRLLVDVLPRMAGEITKIQTALAQRRSLTDPKVASTVDNQTRYEDVTIYPLVANGVEGAVIRVDDVTGRVRMEEMMIQSEKMLSVGGLAAGMAHEINNPLAGMIQTASVISDRLTADLPANIAAAEACGVTMDILRDFMNRRGIPRMLDTISASGRRAAEIVENMLSFARKSDAMVSSHDLCDLMDRTLALAATDYNLKKQYDFKQINIVRNYDPDLPKVPCEGSKIQQVFLNVMKNGAEAMAGAPRDDEPPTFRVTIGRDGPMARIDISDNGPGMPEADRRRVFEPFFTTKPVGQGTGLGLSVSYFIVSENHGGDMTVDTAPGQGTTFRIRLPLERPGS